MPEVFLVAFGGKIPQARLNIAGCRVIFGDHHGEEENLGAGW